MGCVAAPAAKPLALELASEPKTLLTSRPDGRKTLKTAPPAACVSPPTDALPQTKGARGFGDLIRGGVHHVALIVRDVGGSLFFYTDVVGFRQINRVNFDRHGAWLSMGNIQLHLIKGIPHTHRGQHSRDLIVSHIALEVTDVSAVIARLKSLKAEKFKNLHWRQNVSVPTSEASGKSRFESDHTSADGKLTQFFLEDPDGYWLELCNCGAHEESAATSAEQSAAAHGADAARLHLCHVSKIAIRTMRWVRRARSRLACDEKLALELAQFKQISTETVDAEKLENLCLRRNTYGDICQGFTDEQLRGALAQVGNSVPGAILILKQGLEETGQLYQPPPFLNECGEVQHTASFRMSTTGQAALWA